MSIQIEWHDPTHNTIYTRYEGRWTWGEFVESIDRMRRMMNDVPHRVDIVLDMRDGIISMVSPKSLKVWHEHLRQPHHPNEGRIIFVGADSLIVGLFEVYRRVYSDQYEKHPVIFVDSLPEVRELTEELAVQRLQP